MRTIFTCLLLLLSSWLLAQEEASSDSASVRRIGVLPVPVLGYAPETRGYIGAACLVTLKLHPDTLTRTSNLSFEFNYTQNRQILVDIDWEMYTREDRFYLNGGMQYMQFPDLFWGIGNKTGNGDEEDYDSQRLEADIQAYRRIKRSSWYVGPLVRFRRFYDIQPEENGQLNSGFVQGAGGGQVMGVGLGVLWDSRDNLLNPTKGSFFSSSAVTHGETLGGDYAFVSWYSDVRHYRSFGDNHILALQGILVQQSSGVPFFDMALIGSGRDMRGYYEGRYRDRNYASVQAEWRAHIAWRVGMTAFAGVGDVWRQASDLEFKHLKPTLGTGFRLTVDRKENVNLRVDMAWGSQGADGFYVSFGEAF